MERIVLHYGWQETPDGTYHSFRATDIENPEMSEDEIRRAIAEDLSCDLSDPDSGFCLRSMLIRVPKNTEYRLREQGRMVAKVANIDEPWSNNACEGYIIEAMQRCGYDADAIGAVCAELSKCFDEISVEAASKIACGAEVTPAANECNKEVMSLDELKQNNALFYYCDPCGKTHIPGADLTSRHDTDNLAAMCKELCEEALKPYHKMPTSVVTLNGEPMLMSTMLFPRDWAMIQMPELADSQAALKDAVKRIGDALWLMCDEDGVRELVDRYHLRTAVGKNTDSLGGRIFAFFIPYGMRNRSEEIRSALDAIEKDFYDKVADIAGLKAMPSAGKYRCPKCGAQKFSATAHVTQDWELDGDGDFAEELNGCVETTHRPDEEDIWDCMCCGFSAPGKEFRAIR